MAGNVRLSGRLICVSEAEAGLVRRYLPEHIALTRAETGCLSFEVSPTDDPLIWRVEEVFVDQAAFEAHQARTGASEWARQTKAIRRDYAVSSVDRS
ncbi:MAG: antibiotic biosynthesis monooxygenase [Devosia sp.]|uniref:putative quinol monooxygenase n=1 Tax=Devosia sp. TaxID=1871048 RepID=UPI0024CCE9E3|nr:putative quinol monooxygenase [Devosia sp.]UYO00352.1 MAG: antibiotic biosynthesis monooxygenase [Devosia sp.]